MMRPVLYMNNDLIAHPGQFFNIIPIRIRILANHLVNWLERTSMSCIINTAASDFHKNSAHDSDMYVHPLIVYASCLT